MQSFYYQYLRVSEFFHVGKASFFAETEIADSLIPNVIIASFCFTFTSVPCEVIPVPCQ